MSGSASRTPPPSGIGGEARTPEPRCEACGGPLGRRRSVRCVACAQARRQLRTKEASHRHYVANKVRVLAGARAWERRHPDATRTMRRRWARSLRGRSAIATRIERRRTGVPYAPHEIFERDGWTCQLCGGPVDPGASRHSALGATIDHVLAISRGGVDAPENVQTAHRSCNSRKGAGPTSGSHPGRTSDPTDDLASPGGSATGHVLGTIEADAALDDPHGRGESTSTSSIEGGGRDA